MDTGITNSRLESPTGATLNLYSLAARGTPRGVVQINHGLAEHAARYGRFMQALAQAGFHSYAHDHRGHGETVAPDAPPGRFAREDGAARVIADVKAVHDHIATVHPGLPVIAFGHSMGGLIAMNYAFAHADGLKGLAVWNANFSAGLLGRLAQGLIAWEKFRLGSDAPSRLLPKLTFQDWAKKVPQARTAFDWLSRDAAEVDKYVADPLCGWDASVSMWRDVFELIFAGADDANLKAMPHSLPINLVGGEKDPATDGGKAVTHLHGRLARLDFLDLTCTILPSTRHESLNETNRDETTAGFITWASQVCGVV
ncbi:MAG: alpha/beta hydrolase [Notoacmeibacter sp.]|nr:alpha/beta hydrolase [Notoacmeibacter sp.]